MTRKISGNLLDIYIAGVRSREQPSGFLIVVGIKVAKKSTQRNRVKRRLRSIGRALDLANKSGLVIKITAKPAILSAKFAEVKAEAERLWRQYENSPDF